MKPPDHTTTTGAAGPVFAALWEAHRRRMLDLAFRMLLDFPDAEDVVQETFSRLGRTDLASIDDPEGCQLASRARRALQAESAPSRFPVDSALYHHVSERFIEACTGGDLDGLLALLDPAVEGAGDTVPGVTVGAAVVAPGILRYLGPPASPTLIHLPVGDRVGIVAMHDHRVLALIILKIANGLVVQIDALSGQGPRAAASAALGLR